jgi:hypothetical protein
MKNEKIGESLQLKLPSGSEVDPLPMQRRLRESLSDEKGRKTYSANNYFHTSFHVRQPNRIRDPSSKASRKFGGSPTYRCKVSQLEETRMSLPLLKNRPNACVAPHGKEIIRKPDDVYPHQAVNVLDRKYIFFHHLDWHDRNLGKQKKI